MTKPMWIGEFNSGGSAMMAEEGSQASRCHALPAGRSFQRNEKCSTTGIRPFQPHVMFEQLNGFGSERSEPQLASLAANSQLRFGKQHVIGIECQDLRRPESLQEHQTDYGEVASGAKTRPETSHLIDG